MVKRRLRIIYTDDELKALLDTPNEKDFVTTRTYTIIWVLASTGIRARELRELKIVNVDMMNRAISVKNQEEYQSVKVYLMYY